MRISLCYNSKAKVKQYNLILELIQMGNDATAVGLININIKPQRITINRGFKMSLQIYSIDAFPHGYDGLRLWQAGIMLARYVILNNSLFKHKLVLELGSGVGIAGMTVKQWSECKEVEITDYHPIIIENIKRNLKKNKINCPVFSLDWKHHEECTRQYDIIMGSDVVYFGCPVQDLYQLFRKLLAEKGVGIIIIPDRKNYADLFLKLVEPDLFQIVKQKLDRQEYLESPLQNESQGLKRYSLLRQIDFYAYKMIRKAKT